MWNNAGQRVLKVGVGGNLSSRGVREESIQNQFSPTILTKESTRPSLSEIFNRNKERRFAVLTTVREGRVTTDNPIIQ